MPARMARMWRTASTTLPVPASPLVRIIAAPSEMRRSASPRSVAPQTNGTVKACLSMWWASSAGVSTSLSSMKSTSRACRIWASTKWPMRHLAITGMRHGLLDAGDHLGIAHAGHAAVGADVGRDALEGHDRAGARLLGDPRLLGRGDVHDDAALEHLREAALDPHPCPVRPRSPLPRGSPRRRSDSGLKSSEAGTPPTGRSGPDGRQVGARTCAGRQRAPASAWATATMATRLGRPSRASAGTTRASGRARERATGSSRPARRPGTPAARAAATAAWATRDSRPMATASTPAAAGRARRARRAVARLERRDGGHGAAGARQALLEQGDDRAGVALAGDDEGAARGERGDQRRRGRRRRAASAASSRARRSAASAGSSPSPRRQPELAVARAAAGRPGRWARRTVRCISG